MKEEGNKKTTENRTLAIRKAIVQQEVTEMQLLKPWIVNIAFAWRAMVGVNPYICSPAYSSHYTTP